jgi:hypothetical protein
MTYSFIFIIKLSNENESIIITAEMNNLWPSSHIKFHSSRLFSFRKNVKFIDKLRVGEGKNHLHPRTQLASC